MISLEHLTYTYPGMGVPALQDISLSIPPVQICSVVGPNGAGKSTLAYVVSGFIPHFYHGTLQGDVNVAGKNVVNTPLKDLVPKVGLVFQNPFNQISGTKFTVREEIAFGMENLGVERTEMLTRTQEVMDQIGISDLADRSPLALSGGQMQRVVIASVLAMRPEVLVLDEPTSQLDPIGSREVLSSLRELTQNQRMTILVIEHKLEWLAEYTDRMVALYEGTVIADGSPADVLVDEEVWLSGAGQTRYTQAARQALPTGAWPAERRLPVTLDQAAAGFQAQLMPGHTG